MQDHYKTLGLSPTATRQEIRRAYRVLARRYHPDLNPGEGNEEKFRHIASAYEVLSDPEKRKRYDDECALNETFSAAFDRAHQAYKRQQATSRRPTPNTPPPKREQPPPQKEQSPPKREQPKTTYTSRPTHQPQSLTAINSWTATVQDTIKTSLARLKGMRLRLVPAQSSNSQISSIAIIEISISVFESISGVSKTIELNEHNGRTRPIAVSIPAGVRSGSLVRMRTKDRHEEIVGIIRISHHPWISITQAGLTIEVPLTIAEALFGAKIQVPSLGEPLLVTVAPGIQSGSEVRLRSQGITLPDGTREDLFIRFMIKLPQISPDGKHAKAVEDLESLYPSPIRDHLPKTIMIKSETTCTRDE